MEAMLPRTRLNWSIGIILASVFYAFLIIKDPEVAQAFMLGYVAVLLTVFVLNEVWRKP